LSRARALPSKRRPKAPTSPRRKPPAPKRGYVPVTADDVSDLALLPRRFDSFAAKISHELGMLGDKILPALIRIGEHQDRQDARLLEIERLQREHDDRLAALEAARKDTP
jgi:hypothetical protein